MQRLWGASAVKVFTLVIVVESDRRVLYFHFIPIVVNVGPGVLDSRNAAATRFTSSFAVVVVVVAGVREVVICGLASR